MIMVDWQIKQAIEKGEIKIDPFNESLINPQSLDFRLGNIIGFPKATKTNFNNHECNLTLACSFCLAGAIDPLDKDSFSFDYKEVDGPFLLKAGKFITASMFEHTELAPDICARVMGKSSGGRLGIGQSHYAGWVDGGWRGCLTLELSNSTTNHIKLTPGMKIGQLIFYRTEVPDKDYKITGRYADQQKGMGSKGL